MVSQLATVHLQGCLSSVPSYIVEEYIVPSYVVEDHEHKEMSLFLRVNKPSISVSLPVSCTVEFLSLIRVLDLD